MKSDKLIQKKLSNYVKNLMSSTLKLVPEKILILVKHFAMSLKKYWQMKKC